MTNGIPFILILGLASACPAMAGEASSPKQVPPAAGSTPTAPAPTPPGPAAASPAGKAPPGEPWRALTRFDFAALPINEMPPDDGNVSPIATEDQSPAGSSVLELERIAAELPKWAPGHVADPVQRVRNYLFLLGAPDFAQAAIERFLPGVVLNHMLKEFPRDELAQLLCWVALHPGEGDHAVLRDPLLVRLAAPNLNPDEIRLRTHFYGVKLTRWVIGW